MDEQGRRSLGAPKRLSQGDPASLGTQLVRAARGEAPPPGASGRALLALGLGAASATSVLAGTASAATKGAAGAGGLAPTVAVATKGILGAGLSTWMVGGVLVVAATGGVLAVGASSSRGPASSASSARSSAPSSAVPRVDARSPSPTVDPLPVTSTPTTTDEASPEATPRVHVAPLVPPPRALTSAAASAPPASPSTLSIEVALVDGAREALADGDPARALTILDRYDREHPGGVLAPEAALLRARARAKSAPTP